MLKRTVFICIVAAQLMGCAQNPADNTPSATVKTPTAVATSTPAPASENAVTQALSPESTVGFVGSKVTGSHEGGFKTVTGSATFVPADQGGPAVEKVEIEMDMTTTFSDDEKLTDHLKSADFFDIEKYPKSTFTSTSLSKGEGDNWEVTGNLNFHGVEKSITFPATITIADGVLSAKAEFDLNRKDFGIVYPGKPDNLIRDEVVIKFDVKTAK